MKTRNRISPKKNYAKKEILKLLKRESDLPSFTSQKSICNYLLDKNLVEGVSARCIYYAIRDLIDVGEIEKDAMTKNYTLSLSSTQSSLGKHIERTPFTVIPATESQCYIDIGNNYPISAYISQCLNKQSDPKDLRFYSIADNLILCLSLPETLEYPKGDFIEDRVESMIESMNLTLDFVDYPTNEDLQRMAEIYSEQQAEAYWEEREKEQSKAPAIIVKNRDFSHKNRNQPNQSEDSTQ